VINELQTPNSLSHKLALLKLPIAISFVGLTLLVAGIVFSLPKGNKGEIIISQEKTASVSAYFFVDVSGAVNKPGVYKLAYDVRIDDALAAAGGLTQGADIDYVSQNLNRAAKIKDGMKIYIPVKGEKQSSGGSVNGVTASININRATLSQIDSLPDIGSVRAQKIIDNRPYSYIEELVEKKILPQGVFEKVKEKISVY
jgi:competence protein ComEA